MKILAAQLHLVITAVTIAWSIGEKNSIRTMTSDGQNRALKGDYLRRKIVSFGHCCLHILAP